MGKRLNNLTSTIGCYFPVGTSADPEFAINLSKLPFLLKNKNPKTPGLHELCEGKSMR